MTALATIVLITSASVQAATFSGSATVRVTDDAMTIGPFVRSRFPQFVRESLARHYKLGGKVKVTPRNSEGESKRQDIELEGPSRCLAAEISRVGWQKLRFEFNYEIDDAFYARTTAVRYEFYVRFVSGHVADYQQDSEPPAERYKQISPEVLGDLAKKLAGFMREELTRACFDKSNLTYCPMTVAEPCQ